MQADFEYTSISGYTFEGTVEKDDLYGLRYNIDYITEPEHLGNVVNVLNDTGYDIVNMQLARGLWEYLNSEQIWRDQD